MSGDPDSMLKGRTMIPFAVAEKAPSHDGTPCFSSWEGRRAADPRNAKWVEMKFGQRPMYSIQIYDTTPNSRDTEHIKALALKLHKSTLRTRMCLGDPDSEDRLDVYSLAMPADTSDEDRVNRCIAHQKAEIVSRHSTGKTDFYISGTYETSNYRRFLVIIDGPVDQLDGGESEVMHADTDMDTDEDEDDSPFIAVFWDYPEAAREENLEIDGPHTDDLEFHRVSPGNLGTFISCEVKPHIGWFKDCYVFDRLIEKEVARYARRRAENESGDPGHERLLETEPCPSSDDEMGEEETGGDGDGPKVEDAQEGVAAMKMDSGSGPKGEGP